MGWALYLLLGCIALASLYALLLPRARAQSSRKAVAALCLAVAKACFGKIVFDNASIDAFEARATAVAMPMPLRSLHCGALLF